MASFLLSRLFRIRYMDCMAPCERKCASVRKKQAPSPVQARQSVGVRPIAYGFRVRSGLNMRSTKCAISSCSTVSKSVLRPSQRIASKCGSPETKVRISEMPVLPRSVWRNYREIGKFRRDAPLGENRKDTVLGLGANPDRFVCSRSIRAPAACTPADSPW